MTIAHSRYLLTALLTLALNASLQGQDVTVLEKTIELELTGTRSAVCRHHETIRINNEHGDGAASFYVGCGKDLALESFSGVITDATGRVLKKVKKSELIRSEYSEALASDDYQYVFPYSPTSHPVTVTYDWETEMSHGIYALPVFAPQTGYEMEVVKASYHIQAPQGTELRWHAENCSPVVREGTDAKGHHLWDVEMDSLAPLHRYAWGEPLRRQRPAIYFIPSGFEMGGYECDLSSWQTFGKHNWTMNQGRDQLPPELIERLHQLTNTCQSDRSRVRMVRQLLGETTRYVNIELGIGGFQTRTAQEVYRTGFGDCKALTNYFCAMLHALGLPAVYTLISTEHERLFADFPSLQQLNHVIAQVPLPGDTLWVECTNARVPYDYIPASWADHDALLITEEGGVLTHVPAQRAEQNVEAAHYDIDLKADGSARIAFSSYETGLCFEQDLHMLLAKDADRRKAVLQSIYLPKGTIERLDVSSEGSRLELGWEATSQGYGRRTGSRLFVPVCPYQYAKVRNTKEPAHVIDQQGDGYTHRDTIVLHLPEGYEIEQLPQSGRIETEFGCYEMAVRVMDEDEGASGGEGKSGQTGTQAETGTPAGRRTVRIVSEMTLNNGRFDSSHYEAWLTFRKNRATMSRSEMVIRL